MSELGDEFDLGGILPEDFPTYEFRKPLPGSWADLLVTKADIKRDHEERPVLLLEAHLLDNAYGTPAFPYRVRLYQKPDLSLGEMEGLQVQGLVRHYRHIPTGQVFDVLDRLSGVFSEIPVDKSIYSPKHFQLLPL